MSRPNFITQDDIIRWDENIKNDPNIPSHLAELPTIKEVLLAGLYLGEELYKLQCPTEIITRIQYTCGKLSFGRDPWDMATILLDGYKNNSLELRDDDIKIFN